MYWVEYESLVGRGTLKVLGIVIFIKSFVYKKMILEYKKSLLFPLSNFRDSGFKYL